jgi:uncharacterized SAM-binding protein YcdF (DUF218 family)
VTRTLRKILACFLLLLCIWLAGLAWFISQIPTENIPADTHADAIVVLTGGGGRLEYGLQLLSEGKANKLFISGVHENITAQSLLRHAPDAIREKLEPTAARTIILGHRAENTIGNAEETARWLKSEGGKTILLVTANYHMPRSVEEFEETTHGITIIPAPVVGDDFVLANWWARAESRNLLLSEYHKYIASKLRHWIVSTLRRP